MDEPLLRIAVFTALVGLAFAPLEHVFGTHRGARRGRLTDLGFATLGEALAHVGLAALFGLLLGTFDYLSRGTPLFGAIDHRGLRHGLEIVVGLLVFECMGYAYHRAAHSVPWLWRLHRVHHSAEKMDWLASFRQHPLEIIAVTAIQNLPLIVLGIPLASHAVILLLLRVNTVFVHSDLRLPLGAWRHLIATPRFHHRHHQRTGTAANFSAMFPWLDRLLGTYDDGEADAVGLPHASPRSLLGLLWWPLSSQRTTSSLPSSD